MRSAIALDTLGVMTKVGKEVMTQQYCTGKFNVTYPITTIKAGSDTGAFISICNASFKHKVKTLYLPHLRRKVNSVFTYRDSKGRSISLRTKPWEYLLYKVGLKDQLSYYLYLPN